MNTTVIALGAALLLGVASAHAGSNPDQAWAETAAAAVSSAVPAEKLAATPTRVSAEVGPKGRLLAPKVVRSSGSLDQDKAAVEAVRAARLDRAPYKLEGRRVQLEVGASTTALAQAR